MTRRLGRYDDAAGRRTGQDSNGGVGGAAIHFVNVDQLPAHDAAAEHHAVQPEKWRVRRRVEVGEHSRVRIRAAPPVRAQGEIQDRRVARKARTLAQDFRKGQTAGPDECQAILKSHEPRLELSTPESAALPGPHHDEHLFRLRQQLQNQIDDSRKIANDRDSGLVFSKRRVTQILLINRCQQERYVGKELLSIFARERRCGTSERDDEVRLGTIGERRSDVVDNRVFGRADKPCGANHDFNDIHGLPDPLAQVDAEVGGCVVVRHVAAVERLQQQHVSNRRLSFARRRSEHQQARHRGTLESPTDAWHMAILPRGEP
jgi:hypothetical protein